MQWGKACAAGTVFRAAAWVSSNLQNRILGKMGNMGIGGRVNENSRRFDDSALWIASLLPTLTVFIRLAAPPTHHPSESNFNSW